MITPELMVKVGIPYKSKEFLFHRGCSFDATSILQSGLIAGGKESRGRHTVFFTPLDLFGDNPDEEHPGDDFSKQRKAHYHSKWKTTQDAVYWVNLARTRDNGFRVWQTRSNAVIVYNSLPAISQKREQTLVERLSTPRPAPKIAFKSSWQTQQQQQQDTSESSSSRTPKPVRKVEREQKEDQGNSTENPETSRIRKLDARDESTVEKEPEFKVDLRVEGIAHGVILKDEERMGKIKEVVGILTNGSYTKSIQI